MLVNPDVDGYTKIIILRKTQANNNLLKTEITHKYQSVSEVGDQFLRLARQRRSVPLYPSNTPLIARGVRQLFV